MHEMGLVRPTAVIFLIFFFFVAAAAKLETFHKNYPNFTNSLCDGDNSELVCARNAAISKGALQVTFETANPDYKIANQAGRVMFRQPFKLWDGDINSTVASFNISFLVNLKPHPNNGTPGEGLAFLIAPTLQVPENSYGQYLGLTNATNDNQTTNGIIAVELDTVQQDYDIDDNHIGLNIHSIKSVANKSVNTKLASNNSPSYNIWVQYDGVEKVIQVYIMNQTNNESPTPPMPRDPIIEKKLDLRTTVNQSSYFGFAASTGDLNQLNCVLRWNITIVQFVGPESPWLNILLGVGIPVVAALAVLLGYYLYKKRLLNQSQSNIRSRLRTQPGMPKEFRFRELKKATNNFDEKRELGRGGYGVVYKGLLAEENVEVEVAVKCFLRESLKGEDDFLAELTIINRLRHKHLVRLLGWCHKNRKLLLVYEYMQKGSLDQHLFTVTDKPLSWTLRCKILADVASALHYLHYEYDQKVVHRDIKASNIMLDAHFNAHLGDFGLARALDNEKTHYAEVEGVHGTFGYLAPEHLLTGKATSQSDIYAFGALLIEVVSGQRPGTKINGFQLMVDYVWSLYREGHILDVVDKRIANDYVAEEAQRFLLLGLACSHPIASERPNTQAIVQMISGSMLVPQVPPFKPAFVWPAMMPLDDLSQAISIDTTPLSKYQSETDWSRLSRENYLGYTDRSMV